LPALAFHRYRSRGNGSLAGSVLSICSPKQSTYRYKIANHYAPGRTDGLARTVMPTFTDYVRDLTQFRKFERELLVLVTEAQTE
jgi:hypothetical protein